MYHNICDVLKVYEQMIICIKIFFFQSLKHSVKVRYDIYLIIHEYVLIHTNSRNILFKKCTIINCICSISFYKKLIVMLWNYQIYLTNLKINLKVKCTTSLSHTLTFIIQIWLISTSLWRSRAPPLHFPFFWWRIYKLIILYIGQQSCVQWLFISFWW